MSLPIPTLPSWPTPAALLCPVTLPRWVAGTTQALWSWAKGQHRTRGLLQGRHVLIPLPEHASILWHSGHFGTGRPGEEALLTDVEAFFLSWALGSLTLYHSDQTKCSHIDVWKAFSSGDDGEATTFIDRYIIYHHYRAQGWVVRPALQYGGDYSLYVRGVTHYHSSHIVLILASTSSNTSTSASPWTLTRLYGAMRVCTQARKSLIIAWTSLPPSADPSSPHCISTSSIHDALLTRWIPEQDRDDSSPSSSSS